jgi:hypothetical protein
MKYLTCAKEKTVLQCVLVDFLKLEDVMEWQRMWKKLRQ